MKRLLTLFIAIVVTLTAAAQGAIKQSIILDASTFRPVQTDALTGVNIDPIGVDRSRRPCARIKIFFHQMTREQMQQLEAEIPSGVIECTKCKVAEGNTVLILEMTARDNTKFYLKHPKFGTSNEVAFNLEGNKEYQMEATLNKQLTINIASNVAGASVYLNNEFRGTTQAPNNICTIADLFQGKYTLRLEYGDRKSEQSIEVIDGSSIYFRLDIDETAPVYQYLIINTAPKSALVEVDGKSVQRKNGKIEVRLAKGVHQYQVSADDYYTYTDTVMIDGKSRRIKDVILKPQFGFLKINHSKDLAGAEVYVSNRLRGTLPLDKPIAVKSGVSEIRIVKNLYQDYNTSVTISDDQTSTINADLKPNFAEVTINADGNSEIWIDDQLVGTGKWTGRLEIGKHPVICKKESHEEYHHLLDVPSTEAIVQNYNALKPIYGSLDISCNIDGAKYYVDDVERGTAPNVDNNILVGQRKIKVSAPGYKNYIETVVIEKGKTITVSAELKKGTSYTPSSSSSYSSSSTNSSSYKGATNYKSRKYMLQAALGLEWTFGSVGSTISIPLEMRIGRVDQLINGFIGVSYVHKSNKLSKKSSSETSISSNSFSPVARLRLNTKRSSDTALFYEIGAMYNLAHSAKYNEIKVASKPNITGMASIGYGFSLMELYLLATYDITKAYDTTPYTNSDVQINTISTSSGSVDMQNSFFKNRFTFGFGVKLFFGSGFMKK